MSSPIPDKVNPAFEFMEGDLKSGVLLLCDHARPFIPAAYQNLGLPDEAFSRHIAYDIGAEWLTSTLAEILKAPAVLCGYSRLLIDPNRGRDDPTLIMQISDGQIIPGNRVMSTKERETRKQHYWQPYRTKIAATLLAMEATGVVPAIVSIHSFTPVMKNFVRPWQVAVLWDSDPRINVPLIDSLRREDDLSGANLVGNNEPYDGALKGDTLYDHATQNGLAHTLIEVRQDLIATQDDAEAWAHRLAKHLRPILDLPHCHEKQFYPSRAK